MFALGIGSGVDTSQLRQIASSNDNVFTAPGFDELESVVKPIVEKTCPSKGSNTSKVVWRGIGAGKAYTKEMNWASARVNDSDTNYKPLL